MSDITWYKSKKDKKNKITQTKEEGVLPSDLSDLLGTDYDAEADVLYIRFIHPIPKQISYETDDVIICKTIDGRLSGIDIVDFKKRIGA